MATAPLAASVCASVKWIDWGSLPQRAHGHGGRVGVSDVWWCSLTFTCSRGPLSRLLSSGSCLLLPHFWSITTSVLDRQMVCFILFNFVWPVPRFKMSN